MNKLLSLFLDRLAERFYGLMAGVVSSRVESLHAVVQADQQSQLEDLARKYETEGKTEIAATLRQRAARLTSTDLAEEAMEVMQRMTDEHPRLAAPERASPQSDLRGLPDFNVSRSAPGRKRRKSTDSIDPQGDTGAASCTTPST
ncbi:MAG: hypothetical protein NTY19_43865 [Planctomycetota bacterium]|nr:hypothetical protein [Planctomycetota bacterium]